MAPVNIFEENPLAGIPTELLLPELMGRFSNCLIAYTVEGKEKDTAANGWRTWGSASEILGLAQYANIRALQDVQEYIEDV